MFPRLLPITQRAYGDMVASGESGLRDTEVLADSSHDGSGGFRIGQNRRGIRVAGNLVGDVLVGQNILGSPIGLSDGPLGRFSPRSHSLTSFGFTLR